MIEFKCDKCETVHRLVDPPEIQQLHAKLALATEALQDAGHAWRLHLEEKDYGKSVTLIVNQALTKLGSEHSSAKQTVSDTSASVCLHLPNIIFVTDDIVCRKCAAIGIITWPNKSATEKACEHQWRLDGKGRQCSECGETEKGK